MLHDGDVDCKDIIMYMIMIGTTSCCIYYNTLKQQMKILKSEISLEQYADFISFNGRDYIPTRKILHWKRILSEIRNAGFKIQMFQYDASTGKEPEAIDAATSAGS